MGGNHFIVDDIVVNRHTGTVVIAVDCLCRVAAYVEGHLKDAESVPGSLTHMNRIRPDEIVGGIEAVSLRNCPRASDGQIVPRSAGAVAEGDSASLKIRIPNSRAINPKHGIARRR